MSATNRLAVYGSLAPGGKHNDLLRRIPGMWHTGTLRGYVDRRGPYPILHLDPEGEILAVHVFESPHLTALWDELDAFEGEDYERVLTTVQCGTDTVEAFIYVGRNGRRLQTLGRNTTAVILVDHGSRFSEANAVLEAVAKRVQDRLPDSYVTFAHMELAEPSIAQAFAACAERGATTVIVHPYFLAPGRHSTEDIPRLAAEAAAQYPHLTYYVTAPLNTDDRIVQVVIDRIQETVHHAMGAR